MGVDVEVYRRRIGGFNSGWSNMAATWRWKKGCGVKACSLSLCIALSLILICGMDIEVNLGPTQTRLTALEQRSTRNPRNQGSSPEEGARHRPTEVILEDILSKLEGFNNRFDKMEEKLEAVTEKMEKTIEDQTEIKKENVRLARQVRDLEDKLSYLEGQSKRNNLVFHGIPEEKEETWDDCEAAVRKILEEKMDMEEAWRDTDIAIERAHRIGRFSKGRTRPIIVKFANYKHKNNVFKDKSKLQGSDYRIQEQFSDKIMQERKSFQPMIEKAIKEEKSFFVRYNKLIIDDIVYRFDYETNAVRPLKDIQSSK